MCRHYKVWAVLRNILSDKDSSFPFVFEESDVPFIDTEMKVEIRTLPYNPNYTDSATTSKLFRTFPLTSGKYTGRLNVHC